MPSPNPLYVLLPMYSHGPRTLGFCHCRNKIVLMMRAPMRTAPPVIAPTSAGFENPLVKPNVDVDVVVVRWSCIW